MTDEIKVKIGADGATQAAAQVDKLTAALEKQKKTQEMILKTSAQVREQNVIDALKKEAAAVNTLDDAYKKQARSAVDSLDKIGSGAEANTAKIRASTAAGAALIGNLGRSFSEIVPQSGQFIASIQSAGMAGSQFLGILGGGTGLVVGGLVAAVGLLAKYFSQASQEGDKLAKTVGDNTDAAGSYLDQLNKLRADTRQKNQVRQEEDTRQKRLNRGTASTGEYEEEYGAIQGMLSNRTRALEERADAGGLSGETRKKALRITMANDPEITKLKERLSRLESGKGVARLTDNSEAANASDKAEIERALATAGGSGTKSQSFDYSSPEQATKRNKLGSPYQPQNDSRDFMMDQYGQSDKGTQLVAGVMSDQAATDKAAEAAFTSKKKWAELDVQMNQETLAAIDGAREESTAKDLAMANERANIIASIDKQEAAAKMAMIQMATGAALKGISEVLKGKKVELGAILESVGDQAVASGTMLMFTGAGLSANPLMPGSGAGMVSIGAAEVAFGLGLGAVGARMPGGSNSGGGGSGAAVASFDTASPYRNSFTPPQNSGPTIININMPTVLSPSAEDGLRMKQAADAAFNVYGAKPNYVK